MLRLTKLLSCPVSDSMRAAFWIVFGLSFNTTILAVESDHSAVSADTNTSKEIWIKLPIRIQPIEKLGVRDYKGTIQETYVTHQSSTKNLRIRANRSNDLYFGPWRFHVDASRMDRLGGVDISVRVSHIDNKTPETYFDLGQKLVAGKVLRDGPDLRFITPAQGRFQNESSPFMADIEFGVIEENERRMLSALDFVSRDEFRNSPNQ